VVKNFVNGRHMIRVFLPRKFSRCCSSTRTVVATKQRQTHVPDRLPISSSTRTACRSFCGWRRLDNAKYRARNRRYSSATCIISVLIEMSTRRHAAHAPTRIYNLHVQTLSGRHRPTRQRQASGQAINAVFNSATIVYVQSKRTLLLLATAATKLNCISATRDKW